ncbi:hypothetical protein VTL71DRAFT_1335 [Oculimacula yallundae]|uniref:Uncharacterized protein n=1 Tax=Oculimacula yallundae TaxID=86028 RepID=A0ABR4CAF9_9HELO
MTVQGSNISGLWGEDTPELLDLGDSPTICLIQSMIDRKRDQLIMKAEDVAAIASRNAWINFSGVRHFALQHEGGYPSMDLCLDIIDQNRSLKTFSLIIDQKEQIHRERSWNANSMSLLKIDTTLANLVPLRTNTGIESATALVVKYVRDANNIRRYLYKGHSERSKGLPVGIVFEVQLLAEVEREETCKLHNHIWLDPTQPRYWNFALTTENPYYDLSVQENVVDLQIFDLGLRARCRFDGTLVTQDDRYS